MEKEFNLSDWLIEHQKKNDRKKYNEPVSRDIVFVVVLHTTSEKK
jgi:hypothetical protein